MMRMPSLSLSSFSRTMLPTAALAAGMKAYTCGGSQAAHASA